jgi:hypothetical protein
MAAIQGVPPQRLSFEQQKKLAKELLDAFRSGESGARSRIRAVLPDKPTIALADAQFVLARENGFQNWAALKRLVK